jgi:hypothetical protein
MEALRLLDSIVSDNDLANDMLKPKIIRILTGHLMNENEVLQNHIVMFLKNIAESDMGVKRERQQAIISNLKKILGKSKGGVTDENAGDDDGNSSLLDRYLFRNNLHSMLESYGVREPE